ncbi:MAG: MarR family transcriptional regulator [Candidatus Dormibacteraeota bacterium]|jgi:DNA-binding MarR family transcriptional regulator|nr:MarR family transcriptional regulator [Candidatus Dormibacteraeota bacterium]
MDEGLSPVAATLSLLQAHRLLEVSLDRRLVAATGLSLSEAEVLVRLGAASGGRMGMLQLAQATCFSRSGVSRIVDRLERKDLIRRSISAEDRRLTWVEATTVGRDLMWELLAALQVAVEEDFARYLSDDDVVALADRLDKLVAGIRSAESAGDGDQSAPAPRLGG